MVLTSLGGSGEKGRVGFLLEDGRKRIVLDYGIKRRLCGGWKDIYPLEVKEKVDLLYLSHAHQDHVGAVPLLSFERIISSEPTLKLMKHYIYTWFKTARRYELPIDAERYEDFLQKEDFKIMNTMNFDGLFFKLGKSGHLLGSTWVKIRWDGVSLLYTGDITLDSPIYRFDEPEKADVLIMDCAYGLRRLKPREDLLNVLDSLKGNRIILPLPSVGRSQEILLTLLNSGILPVFVDEKIVRFFNFLSEFKEWLKVEPKIESVNTELPEKLVEGIYLTTDGMITGGTSLKLYNLLKDDEKTRFILTGYQERGTTGWKILNEEDRAMQFIWKVHPDFTDILTLIDKIDPYHIIIFHADEKDSSDLVQELGKLGFKSSVLEMGKRLKLGEIT